MKPFIHDNFLLDSHEAVRLYHDYAKDLPIIDFHSHLPPVEVATNKSWDNISQVWLDGDHYKWRAMRANGIDERYCTGDASDLEKFDAFAATMPYLLRNPLFHWSHLELARYFGIDDQILSPETADDIWRRTSEVFQAGLSVHDLIRQSKVEVICTTDDPIDSLEHHAELSAGSAPGFRMLPTWRPDKILGIDQPEAFNCYLDRLEIVSESTICDYDDLISSLLKRHAYFHELGCRLSDRGMDVFSFEQPSDSKAREVFAAARSGASLSPADVGAFQSAMLVELGRMDAEKGWTMQMHVGAMRFNCTRMGDTLGYDSIDDRSYAAPLARFLNALDREEMLPKTILYNLNPSHNEMIATMIGNFQDGITPGKIQFGSGWWFLDQKNGMERQMEALSQMGLLRRFVGMVTDSRSFLSFTRHEYFRRVLCNLVGNDIKMGLLPEDYDICGQLIEDICYKNAASYFKF